MSELQRKLGKLLEMERRRRGLNLADLSTELKISESNLTSIETGDADALPAELYYQLFAKSYSEFLGIDYSKTLEAIREDIGEPLEPPEKPEPTVAKDDKVAAKDHDGHKAEVEGEDDSKFGRRAIVMAAIIIVVFGAFLLGYRLLFDGDSSHAGGTLQTDSEFPTNVEHEPAAEEIVSTDYDWSASGYVEPDSLRLSLTAREASWATIVADGDTVIYRNLIPWRTYQAAARYRLQVSIGIPRVVEVLLNGQPVDLSNPQTGRISKIKINQINLDRFVGGASDQSKPTDTRPGSPLQGDAAEMAPSQAATMDST
jgi:cytoskeletal protein RodZ